LASIGWMAQREATKISKAGLIVDDSSKEAAPAI
jgi:hypothetical protein